MASERFESNFRRTILVVLGLPLVALIVMPLFGLLTRSSPDALWGAMLSPAVLQALILTMATTSIVVLCTILAGTPLAILMSTRTKEFHWARTLIDIPAVLPPAVAGIALLSLFGRFGLFGQQLAPYGVFIPFTTAAVILAQLFVAAPLYIRACMIAFDRLDPLLADAARIDGATQWQYWTQVVWPLARHGLQAGIALTSARALGEFGATALFAGNMPGRTRTMALAIYVAADTNPEAATAMSILLLAIALVLLGITNRGSATDTSF
jgi:molybdate transport system permease protein